MPSYGSTDHAAPEAGRSGLEAFDENMLARIGPTPSGLAEVSHEIPMRDGSMSKVKIYRPSDGPAGPLIVLCFGGGFMGGSPDQLSDIARSLAELVGATVVNIGYRLAPEHKFPAAQLDTMDSVKWIAENATSSILAADPSKGFILGGVSAGASLTTCLSRYFQHDKLAHQLTGQWLSIPPIMDADTCPERYRHLFISREQNAEAPVLDKETLAYMGQIVQADPTSELYRPTLSKAPISGQPKTYFQICGLDPFRDDGLIYDEMLKEAGIQTKVDFYPGCPHGHWILTLGTEISTKAYIDSVVGIGWLLGKDIAREDAKKAMVL